MLNKFSNASIDRIELASKAAMESSRRPFKNPSPTMLKSINKRRFLEELRRRGPSTRAELTRAIGVAPPTSSAIIADLLEAGFLEQGITHSDGKGRPGTYFKLASSDAYVIGATLDISECKVRSAGLDGRFLSDRTVTFLTPNTYPELINSLSQAIKQVKDASNGECRGVGLAVPGLLDDRLHRVAFSPNLHILDGQDIGSDLSSNLGCNVICTQEEHALCLSEQNQGAADGLTDFAVVDFSSGVGMGVVSGGRYVSGTNGFACEIGHTTVEPDGKLCGCGNRGCLETVASDTVLLQRLSNRLNKVIDIEEFHQLYSSDHEAVNEELERVLSFVAIGLATVVNIFNPQVVFVNGMIFGLDAPTLKGLSSAVETRSLRPSYSTVKIKTATGNKLHGAVAGLLDHLFAEVGPTLTG